MGTAVDVDGAFAVWNVVVTTFSDSGWHSADGRSLAWFRATPCRTQVARLTPTDHPDPIESHWR
jgi:hypothetical protein